MMSDNTYARVSSLAVISAVSGMATGLSLMVPPLALFAIVGIGSGVAALSATRRYELGGAKLARFGVIASVLFALGGPITRYVEYRLEAPSGYLRLDFRTVAKHDSPEPLDLYLGEKICLKGYSLSRSSVLGQFLLTPNMSGGFGDVQPVVLVELPAGQTWERNDNRLTISGTLERIKRSDPSYQTSAKFKLTDAIVRWSLLGAWSRQSRGGC